MALTQTPVTELDAINMMLMSIGQSPVSTVSATGIKDVEIALLWLHNTSREIQNHGWKFNSDKEYELAPDGNNRIVLPSNALYADPTAWYDDWVWRYDESNSAMSLYNAEDQTFERTEPLEVDIVWFYEFEKTPPSFRNYCAKLAGQRFQTGSIGSELLFKFEQNEINDALLVFEREQELTADRNILAGADFTNQIFRRRRNP